MNNEQGIYRNLKVNQYDLEIIRGVIMEEQYYCLENGYIIPKRLHELLAEVNQLIKDIENSKTRYWLKFKEDTTDFYLENFDIIDGFVEYKDLKDRWEMTFDEASAAIEKYKLNIDNFELVRVKKEMVGEKSDYEAGRQVNL